MPPGIYISVIIPNYNHAYMLPQAIDSILTQSFRNTEIIIVDDGSYDSSVEILNDYCTNRQIKLIRHEQNRGLSCARNSGLKNANGKYVLFLDADDCLYDRESLEQLVSTAESDNCDMLHSHTKIIHLNEHGDFLKKEYMKDHFYLDKRIQNTNIKETPELVLWTSSWSFLYKKAFIDINQLEFDNQLKKWEDAPFLVNALTKAKSISLYPAITRVHRICPSGTITSSLPYADDIKYFTQHLDLVSNRVNNSLYNHRFSSWAKGISYTRFFRRIVMPVAGELSDELRHEFLEKHGSVSRSVAGLDLSIIDFKGYKNYHIKPADITYRNHYRIYSLLAQDKMGDAINFFKRRCSKFKEKKATTPDMPRIFRKKTCVNKVILHIGLHKTATTYIQKNLFENHADLLLNHGVLFPLSILTILDSFKNEHDFTSPGHLMMDKLVECNKSKQREIYKKICREITSSNSRVNKLLISCEDLSCPAENDKYQYLSKIKFIKEYLSMFGEVNIIVYLRRPDHWIYSLYSEYVTGGWKKESDPFETWYIKKGAHLINYLQRLRPWIKIFGKERIYIRSYDKAIKYHGIINDFYEATDIEKFEPFAKNDQHVYASHPSSIVEMVRLFNKLNYDSPDYREELKTCINDIKGSRIRTDHQYCIPPGILNHIYSTWLSMEQELYELSGNREPFFDDYTMTHLEKGTRNDFRDDKQIVTAITQISSRKEL